MLSRATGVNAPGQDALKGVVTDQRTTGVTLGVGGRRERINTPMRVRAATSGSGVLMGKEGGGIKMRLGWGWTWVMGVGSGNENGHVMELGF